jgi:hypothetical protein
MRRKLVVLGLAVASLFMIAPAQASVQSPNFNRQFIQGATSFDWCC